MKITSKNSERDIFELTNKLKLETMMTENLKGELSKKNE